MKRILNAILLIFMCLWTNYSFADYNEAFSQAKENHQFLFVDFYADWCGPCQQLQTTFEDAAVKSRLKKMVLYRCNVDTEPEIFKMYMRPFRLRLVKSFRIGVIPTYFVVRPSDITIIKWGQGYKSPSRFLQWLSQ